MRAQFPNVFDLSATVQRSNRTPIPAPLAVAWETRGGVASIGKTAAHLFSGLRMLFTGAVVQAGQLAWRFSMAVTPLFSNSVSGRVLSLMPRTSAAARLIALGLFPTGAGRVVGLILCRRVMISMCAHSGHALCNADEG